MQKEHVRVLLASTPETPIHEIEVQLEQTIGLDCHLFQCADLGACLNRIHSDYPHFDIILLDLTLVNNSESKSFFSEIQKAAGDTPVIVFTREQDRELALFTVGAGASVISNPEKFKLETDRLRDLIEHSWIRHKSSKAKVQGHETALKAETARGDKNLEEERKKGADRLKEKDQVISWLSGGYSVERAPTKQD